MAIPNIASDVSQAVNEQPNPRGADKMIRLLQEARMAKQNKNQSAWSTALKEFQLTVEQAQLAEKEKHFKETQGNIKKLREITAELTKTKSQLEDKTNQRALQEEYLNMVRAGNLQQAYTFATYAFEKDSKELERMGLLAAAELRRRSPRIQEWLKLRGYIGQELTEEELNLLIYEEVIKPQMNQMQTPPIAQQIQPTQDLGLDLDIPSMSMMGETPIPDALMQYRNSQNLPQGTPRQQTIQGSDGWSAQDMMNWQAFTGTTPKSTTTTAAKRPEILEIAEYLKQNGIPQEKINELITDDIEDTKKGNGNEPYDWKSFKLAEEHINQSNKPQVEKDKLLDQLWQRKFGSDRQRFASDVDMDQIESIRSNDPLIATGLMNIHTATQRGQQSTAAWKGLANESERIMNNPNLDQETKYAQLLPQMRLFIESSLPESSMDKKNLDGYNSIIAQTDRVSRYMQQPRNKQDLSNTGFIASSILGITSAFGFVMPSQTELAEMDLTNKVTLAEFIRSISGLTVTEQERKFLGEMMYSIGDNKDLTLTKVKGWQKLVSDFLMRTYHRKTGNAELARAMAEDAIGIATPKGFFDEDGEFKEYVGTTQELQTRINQSYSENPDLSVQDRAKEAISRIPDLAEDAAENLYTEIMDLIKAREDDVIDFLVDAGDKIPSLADTYTTFALQDIDLDTPIDNIQDAVTSLTSRVKKGYERFISNNDELKSIFAEDNQDQIHEIFLVQKTYQKWRESYDKPIDFQEFYDEMKKTYFNAGIIDKFDTYLDKKYQEDMTVLKIIWRQLEGQYRQKLSEQTP